MSQSLRPGKVLALDANDGCIHCVFLGRHERYGECVRVGARIVPLGTPPKETEWERSYALFYPASLAVKNRIARVVGVAEETSMPQAILSRVPSLRGPPRGWILEQDDGLCRPIHNLTVEHLRFPLVMLVNHAFLVSLVRRGWSPLDKGSSVDQPTSAPDLSSDQLCRRATSHYIYYRTRSRANAAVVAFRSAGFVAVSKRAATGLTPWLLLVTRDHSEPPGWDCSSADLQAIATIAMKTEGAYDGYERPPV